MLNAERLEAIRAWQAQDPDQATVTALDHLLERAEAGDAEAVAELVDAFAGRLAFGTAGLRAALGPGPNRMNRAVVIRAAAGLTAYLKTVSDQPTVLVGYDARYNSDVFARDTAEILAGHGLRPMLTETHVPTPVVAFGIRHFGCVAGVVVTASHNPPQDNGYKVYVGKSQIIPPIDGEIAAHIAAVAEEPVSAIARSTAYETIGEPLLSAYVARAASLVAEDAPRDLRWVYTPMHGVGAEVVARVLDRTGFPAPALVDAQALPDPAFPTVAFPNPEEKGAMDLALALAVETDADVAIANDPDADRCAAGRPVRRRLADAHRRRARLAAGRRRPAPGHPGRLRVLRGVLDAAGPDGRGSRPAVRDDPDRLQVDRPRARPGVRLRGGHRLLHRPRGRRRQGRHHHADPPAGPRGGALKAEG